MKKKYSTNEKLYAIMRAENGNEAVYRGNTRARYSVKKKGEGVARQNIIICPYFE